MKAFRDNLANRGPLTALILIVAGIIVVIMLPAESVNPISSASAYLQVVLAQPDLTTSDLQEIGYHLSGIDLTGADANFRQQVKADLAAIDYLIGK
jgi:hypothetical protein